MTIFIKYLCHIKQLDYIKIESFLKILIQNKTLLYLLDILNEFIKILIINCKTI